MRIKVEDTVAVIIDIQERLLPVMHEKETFLNRSVILSEGLKALGVPLYVTQQYTKGLGETVEEIRSAAGMNSYIEKINFSAFEDIEPHIKGKKNVIVYGIEAHICVLQTVIDLSEGGYTPVLVTDCITSRKAADKETALLRASMEGAIPTTSEALLFELLQAAGTKTSRIIQKLIK